MADTGTPAIQQIPPIRGADAAAGGGARAAADQFHPFGEDGFTFSDFLDIINPLQHIPIISAIYRKETGDTIEPGPRVLGGTLFGGPIGTAVSVTNVVIEESSGRDMGGHMMALLDSDDGGNGPDLVYGDGPEVVFVPGGEPVDVADYREVLAWARTETAALGLHRPGPADPVPGDPPAAGTTAVAEGIEVLHWARRELAALHRAPAASPQTPPAVPPARHPDDGSTVLAAATAPHGGWFSEVMLAALDRYHEASGLAERPPATRVVVD